MDAFGWVHEDGKDLWFAHDCGNVLKIKRLRFPLWKLYEVNGTRWITPAVECLGCGFRQHVKIIENKET